MIFHSTNNLRKEGKRKKKKKRGHKRISVRAPCNNSDLVHTFEAWSSSLN
jgi:hypothetical protein